MIKLEKVQEVDSSISETWIDPYVSLSFRSYGNSLGGAQYIYVGNRRTSLLEFRIAPGTTTLRGFTLVAFDTLHDPQPLGAVVTAWGLPEVTLPETVTFEGPHDQLSAHVPAPLSFGLGRDCAEVLISENGQADMLIRHGRAGFLLHARHLIGVRVFDLAATEVETLALFVADAKKRGS